MMNDGTRTTIVSGGTRGLGAAICRRIAADGGHVAAIYRGDETSAREFHESALADGLDISIHRADLSVASACKDVVATITGSHGRITRLVNNAGILREAKVLDVVEDGWDAVLDANLKSTFFLTQAVWGAMVEEGFGRIVNIGSVTATSGNPVQTVYGASKGGTIGMTRSLAMAGARKGITVNCVVPGAYATEMTTSMPEESQRRIAGLIPVGRLGRPEELAHVVNALLQDDAAYVTGSVIQADGGLGMGH
jgi:NAD(P)-dependent dehydrogenase (short-subunit alcohol dehydrogenase family)